MEDRDFVGLAGVLAGDPDDRAPLVLLHGLTSSRVMWHPALTELRAITPRGGCSRWTYPVTAAPRRCMLAWNRSHAAALLPRRARPLLGASRSLRQGLVAGYWREFLDRPVAGLAADIDGSLAHRGLTERFVRCWFTPPGYRAEGDQS